MKKMPANNEEAAVTNEPRDNIPSQNEGQGAEEGSEPAQVLIPIEERQVDFYGDSVTAALVQVSDEAVIYVPIRPICNALGVSYNGQRERIRRDNILEEATQGVRISRTPSATGGRGGGAQTTICLPVEMLPAWLFGISASAVKPELQDKIDRYRRECARVLWRAFQGDVLTATRTGQSNDTIAALEQVRQIGIALQHMAEQQIELERRQGATEQRLDKAAVFAQELNRRLKVVERRTEPQQFVTVKQAGQISNQVKALAMYLTKRDNTKNHYAAIFGAIHTYFNVASIERLTRSQFDEVMAFLDEWREAADAAPPGQQLDLFSLDAPAAPQADEQDTKENIF